MYEQGTLLKSLTRHEKYPLFVMVTKGKTEPDKFNGVVLFDAAAGVYVEQVKTPGSIVQNYPASLFVPVEWPEVKKFI